MKLRDKDMVWIVVAIALLVTAFLGSVRLLIALCASGC